MCKMNEENESFYCESDWGEQGQQPIALAR